MTEAKREIGFDQAGLGSILKQNQLVVPPNQREYSWTEREVTQLFQDFSKAITEDSEYFLGTIVTIPRTDGTLEVVDGQQRLATTAILLAAIRDYLSDKNEELLLESINTEFLTGIDRAQRTRVPKLTLNIEDNDFFNSIVTAKDTPKPTHNSHELLLQASKLAQKHVRNIVSTLDSKDHGDILNVWVTFIEQRALAVLLRVPDDANAYKMFETLNDRGLRTSQVDLIKNFLFGRSGKRIGEMQARWAYMRGTLESLDEEEITVNFLRHALIIQRGFLREVEVYEKVQDMVKSEQAAITFASTLENLATSYVAMFNPEHERWNGHPDSVRRAVEVFNLLDIRPLRPLILATTAKFPIREAAKAFQLLLALGVRLLIASTTRSGSVEIPLASAAHMVFQGLIEDASQLRINLDTVIPTDREFLDAFTIARVSASKLGRYYLRSLEMAAKGETEPWFVPMGDGSVINLEHVLPKKPEGNWPQFDDEDVRNCVNRLGNQCLMRASDNSDVRSQSFETKRERYASSPYVLTSQIGELSDWTPNTIAERQKQLAEIAIKTWPVKV